MKLTVLFGLMIYWSIIITAPVISNNSEKFGEKKVLIPLKKPRIYGRSTIFGAEQVPS